MERMDRPDCPVFLERWVPEVSLVLAGSTVSPVLQESLAPRGLPARKETRDPQDPLDLLG